MILVVGCGFVGETVAKSLEQNGQPVIRIDPQYNDNTIDMYLGTPGLGAIVCVPTPTVDSICDDSAIREVLEELGDVPVLLKCTVPPDMLQTYGSNVTYNPCLLYTSPSPRDQRGSRMPSSA